MSKEAVMTQEQGIKYFENIVSYNSEIYNRLQEALPEITGTDEVSGYVKTIMFSGTQECILRIREAVAAARQIYGVDIELSDAILANLQLVKPGFYIKDDVLYNVSGASVEELSGFLTQELAKARGKLNNDGE